MRELILKMVISIDGFVGSVDGGLGWIFRTMDRSRSVVGCRCFPRSTRRSCSAASRPASSPVGPSPRCCARDERVGFQ